MEDLPYFFFQKILREISKLLNLFLQLFYTKNVCKSIAELIPTARCQSETTMNSSNVHRAGSPDKKRLQRPSNIQTNTISSTKKRKTNRIKRSQSVGQSSGQKRKNVREANPHQKAQ